MPQIPTSLIEFSDFSTRRSSTVEEMASSLRREGQLSPIRLREHPLESGRYQVVFGNRRLAAAKKLGWKTIAAEVVRANDAEAVVTAFAENEDRENFSDYERAQLLQRLHMISGKNYTEVAAYIGRSTAFVSQHIAMLHLFPDGVASEKERENVLYALSENHARILARITDDEERWKVAKLAVSENMGVRELQRICSGSKREEKFSPGDQKEPKNGNCPQELREVVTLMLMALNSKDIRPFSKLVSSHHFTMFPRLSPSILIDREEATEYLFNILRRKNAFKMGALSYVDIRINGNVAYLALTMQEESTLGRKDMGANMRGTVILEREKDGWKMVHSHWSAASPAESKSMIRKEEMKML